MNEEEETPVVEVVVEVLPAPVVAVPVVDDVG